MCETFRCLVARQSRRSAVASARANKKVYRDLPEGPEIARVHSQYLRRACGLIRIVVCAGVPCGNRTIVMRSQTTAALERCQLFFLDNKLQGSLAHARALHA